MVTAIYPGTFDPITNGHIDIAQRAAKLFDEVIIAVAERKAEKTLFTKDERLFFVNNLFSNIGNIKSISFFVIPRIVPLRYIFSLPVNSG